MPVRAHALGVPVAALMLALSAALGAVPAAGTVAASPFVTVHVSPASGGPGTRVTLTGTAPEAAGTGSAFGNLCWGGCPNGFAESLYVTWPSRDHFRATFVVPETAYLTADGPHALVDGRYSVAVNCIGAVFKGCAAATQADTTFRVTGPTPAACRAGRACGDIRLSASTARPGDLIRITGWAPVTQIIGRPFGYQVDLARGDWSGPTDAVGTVTQTFNGDIFGTLRLPQVAGNIGLVRPGRYTLSLEWTASEGAQAAPRTGPDLRVEATPKGGGENVYLAPAALYVGALTPWSRLPTSRPDPLQASMATVVTSRTGDPSEIAYCAAGAVRLSTDAGRHWQSVSTRAVAQASRATAFPLLTTMQTAPTPPAACSAVVLDPTHPHTIYAAFSTYARKYRGAPPVFTVLYMTRDGGARWQPVPTPTGTNPGDYAGIGTDASGVTVLYTPTGGVGSSAHAPPYVAERSTDGGATWQAVTLGCPPSGPCVRFGPAPGVLPGMGGATVQPLMRSADGGRAWSTMAWPPGNIIAQGSSGLSQLASYGTNDVLFVDGASLDAAYPALWSTDGGRTWQAIALPLLPGTAQSAPQEGVEAFTGLAMLPDGSLIASNGAYPSPTWYRLLPGARTWTVVPGLRAQPVDGALLAAGARLWWLRIGAGGRETLESAPLP